ncbi:MAG: hypothetical protein J7L14_00015 [Candidatus Diapherotrites archaeon]|nr:hypothetical protein [Candidatus Diapherotrites archaeon]
MENFEKELKKIRISELLPGMEIKCKAVVKIRKGIFKYADGFAFSLILSDESGESIEYTFWGKEKKEVEELFAKISDDSVLAIEGRVASKGKKRYISSSVPPKILESREAEFVKKKTSMLKSSTMN